MVEEPVGVEVVVDSVRVVVQVGVHAVAEKVAVAPAGSPEAEKSTDCDVPESRVAVMVLEAVAPCTTDWSPPLLSEKSKTGGGAVTVKVKVEIGRAPCRERVKVMVEEAVGVDVVVARVRVVAQVGVHAVGEIVEHAPACRLEV